MYVLSVCLSTDLTVQPHIKRERKRKERPPTGENKDRPLQQMYTMRKSAKVVSNHRINSKVAAYSSYRCGTQAVPLHMGRHTNAYAYPIQHCKPTQSENKVTQKVSRPSTTPTCQSKPTDLKYPPKTALSAGDKKKTKKKVNPKTKWLQCLD